MNNSTKVTVVISSYNPEPYKLYRAVKSILGQTIQTFSVIIVDDGSKIPIKDWFKINDQRIDIIRTTNIGLGNALNLGIAQSNSEYIARLDDDDFMRSDRLEKQIEYLDLQKDVVCLGSNLVFFHRDKKIKHRKFPTTNNKIVNELINLRFSIAHSSILFRREIFYKMGGYRIGKGGQDLDLFLQFSRFGQLNNIDEYLTFYEINISGLSVVSKEKMNNYKTALTSYLGYSNLTEENKKQIKRSIRRLKSKKDYLHFVKRLVLILRIKLFGYKINNTDLIKR